MATVSNVLKVRGVSQPCIVGAVADHSALELLGENFFTSVVQCPFRVADKRKVGLISSRKKSRQGSQYH